jgi:alpha-mannosidase II
MDEAPQSPAQPASLSPPQVALGSLFHGLDILFLQPTSLTLLYPLASPANSTDIYLEPMEIATFRLRLG